MLKNKMVRMVSAKPRAKTGVARAPIAKELTTMLAASHWISKSVMMKYRLCGTYHCANVGHTIDVCALVLWDPFDTSLLDAELASETHQFCMKSLTINKSLCRHSTCFDDIEVLVTDRVHFVVIRV